MVCSAVWCSSVGADRSLCRRYKDVVATLLAPSQTRKHLSLRDSGPRGPRSTGPSTSSLVAHLPKPYYLLLPGRGSSLYHSGARRKAPLTVQLIVFRRRITVETSPNCY